MASSYFILKILKKQRITRRACKSLVETETKTLVGSEIPKCNFGSCRICLREGTIPIYGDSNASDIAATIQTFGDIEINIDDNYPKHLCESCHSLLQSAVQFRTLAKESDSLLHQKEDIALEIELNINSFTEEYDDVASTIDDTKPCNVKLRKSNFKSSEEFVTHKGTKQHKNIRIQCSICHGLLTPQMYKRHLARHQSASHLICEVCGKMYRKDNLVRHLQLHSYELPFQCQMCPYRGRFLESLKIHMRTHTGVKPFSCDKCQLRFLTRSNLNRHLLTHKKDRPFKCSRCGRGFYTKRDLDLHFKCDHAGIKDFGCHICGNKYGTRKALMRHELRVHKRDKMAKGRMPLYLQAEYRKSLDEHSG